MRGGPGMTDSLVSVLVPYSRFLRCQDRRSQIAAELKRRDQTPPANAEVMPVPTDVSSAQPLTAKKAEH